MKEGNLNSNTPHRENEVLMNHKTLYAFFFFFLSKTKLLMLKSEYFKKKKNRQITKLLTFNLFVNSVFSKMCVKLSKSIFLVECFNIYIKH